MRLLRRINRLIFWPVCLTLALAAFSVVRAQEKEAADVIKVNTDLVIFDVQVIETKAKRVVSGLTKEDFEINDQGARQQISYFSRDELPLSILLLLDVSGSVRPFIHQIRDGGLAALQHLKAEDEVALIAFADSAELVSDFTRDRSLLAQKITASTASERLGRKTNFSAGLYEAADNMTSARQTNRPVIIIVTDNLVATGRYQQQQILQQLFAQGSVVYAVLVNGTVSTALGSGLIRGVDKYVDETGGEKFYANKHDLDARLALVFDHLRQRYSLGFRPTNTTEDNKFRRVDIRIASTGARSEKTVLLTKRGYYLRRRTD